MCAKPQVFANEVNSWDANCGPLSVTRVSGIPYLANRIFKAFVTLLVVVLCKFSTSM